MKLPSQRKWPSRRFLAFTLALCATLPLLARLRPTPPPVPAKPYHFPSRELADLDRALQARLAIVPDNDFGLGRIGKRHAYFSPATHQEKTVVRNLQKAGQEVVFYVVGRNTMLSQQNWLSYSPVQGPVYITSRTSFQVRPHIEKSFLARFFSAQGVAKDAPNDYKLVTLSRRVFEDESLRNGMDAKIDKWNVVARPIAASSQQCADCHNSHAPWKTADRRSSFVLPNSTINRDVISLGDTVGVALYCYRPALKIEVRHLTRSELLAGPFK